jgi:hypothetical protein
MFCGKRKSVAWATGRFRNADEQKFGCSREGRAAGGQGGREIRYDTLRYGLPVAHCQRCPRKRFTDAAQPKGRKNGANRRWPSSAVTRQGVEFFSLSFFSPRVSSPSPSAHAHSTEAAHAARVRCREHVRRGGGTCLLAEDE